MEIQVQFARLGAKSALGPALAYTGVRAFSRLLTALVPTSGLLALLGALLWFASVLYLFVFITWQRDDNWLAAGIIIGSTLFGGGLFADLIVRLYDTGSPTQAVLSTATNSLGLVLRTIALVPLSGGCVAGARWLTTEIRGATEP
ncbi:MAG TPA: hypothetical protein VH539_08200 [Gemmatimonadaceae bacterium]